MKYVKHDPGYCAAPICMAAESPYDKSCLWYPGEKVCTRMPYTHVQKIQNRLNKLFNANKLKTVYTFYTFDILDDMKVVRPGVSGLNPQKAFNGKKSVERYMTQKIKSKREENIHLRLS